MASDANLALQASVTKTSTFSSAGLTIGSTPRRGLKAHVVFSAASAASGSTTVIYTVEASLDGGSTWSVIASGAKDVTNINSLVTTNAGEVFIPFEVSQTAIGSQAQVRLIQTMATGSSPSTPTVTYFADVLLARPA